MEPSGCGGKGLVRGLEKRASNAPPPLTGANGRSFARNTPEREKTGKRKRADRWRHRGELGKTGDTFISEWRKGEKRRARERERGRIAEGNRSDWFSGRFLGPMAKCQRVVG